MRDGGGVLTVVAFTVDQGRITALDAIRNPDKLTALPEAGPAKAVRQLLAATSPSDRGVGSQVDSGITLLQRAVSASTRRSMSSLTVPDLGRSRWVSCLLSSALVMPS